MPRAALIFDLGNVLVFVDHHQASRRLSEAFHLDEPWVFRKIFLEGLDQAFDRGELTPEAFTRLCASALNVDLHLPVFRRIWCEMFTENTPVVDLVKRLRRDGHRMILLSNTNAWHFEYIRERFDAVQVFDHLILSFELGCAKPDRQIFERAIQLADGPPAVYVDDVAEYVHAAKALGIDAVHFTGEAALRRALRKRGLC